MLSKNCLKLVKMTDCFEAEDPCDKTIFVLGMEELINADGRFGCTKCQNSYTQITNLRRHLKYECGIPPQFECSICRKRFVYKFRMKQHQMLTHAHLEPSNEVYLPIKKL